MDSIGGMLNPIGKMPKTHYKNLLEKANGVRGVLCVSCVLASRFM